MTKNEEEKKIKKLKQKTYDIIFQAVLLTGILPILPYIFGQFYMTYWAIILTIYVLLVFYYKHIYSNSQADQHEQANHSQQDE